MIRFDERREREQRAEFCFEDSLLELSLGVGFMLLGIGDLIGLDFLAGIYFVALFPILRHLKRIITVPRMHHLDFLPDPEAQPNMKRKKLVLSICRWHSIILGSAVLLCSQTVRILLCYRFRFEVQSACAVSIVAIFLLLWAGSALRHLRTFSIAAAALLIVFHWFDIGLAWYFASLGAAIVSSAVVKLQGFVHNYPRMNGILRISRERLCRLAGERLED